MVKTFPLIFQLPVRIEAPRNDKERVSVIRAGFAREKAASEAGVRATKRTELPFTYEDITNDWLTDVLAHDVPGAEVIAHELGPEDNGTANRRRISLTWNQAGQDAKMPASVFCKSAMRLNNRLNLAFGGRDSEVWFFNNIRQHLPEGVVTPESYYSIEDVDSANAISVLKDLSDEVTFCTYKMSPTVEQAKDQLKTLALLHGRFWESDEASIKELVHFASQHAGLILANDNAVWSMRGFMASKDVIPPRLYAQHADIWPCTLICLTRNAAAPATFVHSDCHYGNWFTLPSGKMGLQDFQCIARGHWARDVAYVLSTQWSVELRRQHENDLLKYYLKELRAAGGPDIPWESAWEEVECQLFSVLAYWTTTLTPDPDSQADMQKEDVSIENIKRITVMMDDHDVVAVTRRLNGGTLENK